ncbi:hypothetical protein BIU98_14580 [Curtobacterium sp. MMLR14_010]|uniref:hypothetical protein n=1 Tax=Curtobacterium sp. MMLR14_010 TaxID=1898743 RepID=UPI0008DDBC8F|nr:hypothetical protein [Curtobacterium sp. MMLR14_010]OII38274.1 hypothetical protein BIU98_14580 [Curtobacterium sp. MMLR14_010]
MGEPRDLDDLLAQAEPVDAPPHTVRRTIALAIGLGGTGAAIAAAIAVVVAGGFGGALTAVLWLISLGSVPTTD